MIVTPDFLDHWKTQKLMRLLNDDPATPSYIIRLWAYCQNRKDCRFNPSNLNSDNFQAITRSRADKDALWDAFLTAKFLDLHEDGTIEAHGFYEANHKLVSNWENGKKGGRPAKEKPTGNPLITHPEPKEERGEEEDGEEKSDKQGETEEDETARPFSTSPRNQAFWHGRDYSKAEIPEVKDYEDIRRIKDPIIACMAVSGDHSVSMYGFLVKGLEKSLKAGLSDVVLRNCLIDLCCRLVGEKNKGERTAGKIASALVAEMKIFFSTVDIPGYGTRPETPHKESR